MSLFHQQPAEMSDTAYNNYIRNLIHAVQDQSTDSLETLRKLLASPPPEDNPQEIAALFGAMLHIAIWPIETTSPNASFHFGDIVVEKIRLLLEAGADANIDNHPLINQKNSFHRKPIHNVCHSSPLKIGDIRFQILKLLLDHGADPNVNDDFKHKPLHYSCNFICIDENGQKVADLASLQLLIDHGADLNAKNNYIYTPLTRCIADIQDDHTQQYNLAAYLPMVGITPNTPDALEPNGSSASFNKCMYDLAECLLRNGADPNPSSGTPPLLYALDSENCEVASLLFKYGAHANVPRILKYMDYHLDYHEKDSPIVKLLEERIQVEKGEIYKRAHLPESDDVEDVSDTECEDEFEVDLSKFLSELDCGDRYVELIVSAIIHYMEDTTIDPACKEKMRQYIKYTFGFDASLASVPFEEFIKYPNLRKMTILALERKEAENYEGMSHMMMCHVRNMLAQALHLEETILEKTT